MATETWGPNEYQGRSPEQVRASEQSMELVVKFVLCLLVGLAAYEAATRILNHLS